MQANFLVSPGSGLVTFIRGEDDPKFYGNVHAKGEHALFYFIKRWLNARGFNLIKKRAQQDGHMLGDEYQPYLRCMSKTALARGCDNPKINGWVSPHIMIYSGIYAIRGANEDWNEGKTELQIQGNCWLDTLQHDWYHRIDALAKLHDDMTCKVCK